MKKPVSIIWFRQDLRLSDNPALIAACKAGSIVPVYILDQKPAGDWAMGAASRVWLHHSLKSLDQSLDGHLVLLEGDAKKALLTLAGTIDAQGIFWNRCYEPWRMEQDADIEAVLNKADVGVHIFNGSLLREPAENVTKDGKPYKVFTPFFKKMYANADILSPLRRPAMSYAPKQHGVKLEALDLLPAKPRWDKKFDAYWTPGEDAAHNQLEIFLDHHLKGYAEGRNHPDRENISRLSPYLHWGEISPHQAWHAVKQRMVAEGLEADGTRFLTELGWREFSYGLLTDFPALPDQPLQPRFASFPWQSSAKYLKAWQTGQTGYPIVDAGMRELWETGYMHNRVRMIVASFLIKHLLIHWREGEKWFWDCLVDADLANNSASWQWVAGSGADAAPFFRIFNPILQGKKFDPKGDYVRRWVPELRDIPNKYLHEPWNAPDQPDYPAPIVNHEHARKLALQAFGKTKKAV
jgi:deoxyribodipyrimidine photo-lyase